jgi:hypothetical protein
MHRGGRPTIANGWGYDHPNRKIETADPSVLRKN